MNRPDITDQYKFFDDLHTCAQSASLSFKEKPHRWGEFGIPSLELISTTLTEMAADAAIRNRFSDVVITCGKLVVTQGRFGHERADWVSPPNYAFKT